MYYVYSLKCKDGYYEGNVLATKNRLPISIEFYFAIIDKYKAFEFEKYLKSGSGRAFINKHLVKIG